MALQTVGWLQNAGSVHTAAQLRMYLASLQSGGFPDNASLRARGGVHPTMGTQLAVTQTGSPSMAVEVATGMASIPGSESATQGNYFVVNDAAATISVTAAHGSLARIDLVVINVRDSFYSGVNNDAQLQVVAGTPASSPVAPSAPNNSIALATINVGAGVTSITNANITDQRRYFAANGGTITAWGDGGRPASGEIQEGQTVWTMDNNKLYVWDGSGYGQIFPGYNKLAETVLGGSAASIALTSIPQTYTALKIVTQSRGDFAAASIAWGLRFNSDATAIYNFQQDIVVGTSVTASQAQNETRGYLGEISAASATASCAAQHEVTIHNYTGTTFFKTATTNMTMVTGTGAGGLHVRQIGTLWRSTAAITSITLLPDSGNLIAGTKVSLYGLP